MKNNKASRDASCMDDFDKNSITTDQALKRIFNTISPITKSEIISIREGLNRILGENIKSQINVPSSRNSAMDGYAINKVDIPKEKTNVLKIIGKSLAGNPFIKPIKKGECVRIMTGAVMPHGADTVVIQEHVSISNTNTEIIIDKNTKPEANVRHAGEDISVGEIVLRKGKSLTPADIGLLASLGLSQISVIRRLKVAFFSTGNELRSIGEELTDGEIYDSNRYTLHAMLSRLNVEIIDLGVVKDNKNLLAKAFNEAGERADLLITSGGVSVGEADYVKDILSDHGEINFWKVAIKPGRPLIFGNLSNTLFFGLPGNPVSVMVTFYQFVQPAIKKLSGDISDLPLTIKVSSASKLKKKPGRVEFQRGIIEKDNNNKITVRKTGPQGSGILSSMSDANCFIVLPLDSKGVEPGDLVDVQIFNGII
tara:strand:+ start:3879 stop:5153 length:1275 start_codon:yes stop_codon:yes gene_type:complete